MSSFLKREEYLPHAPVSVGDTVRVNHTSRDCSGRSRSMYIERKHNGTIYAHCHRCDKSGWSRDPHYRPSTPQETDVTDRRNDNRNVGVNNYNHQKNRASRIFPEATAKYSEFGRDARDWLSRYSVGRTEVQDYGIRWHDEQRQLIIPVHGGYSSRNFSGHGSRSYTDHCEDLCLYFEALAAPPFFGPLIVVVEDCISAIRVADAGFDAIALLGKNMSLCVQNHLVGTWKKYVVWLDNDNDTVRHQQNVLRNRLELFGNVTVVRSDEDPKCYSVSDIQRYILK